MLPSWLSMFFNERLQELHFQMVTLLIIKKGKKKKKRELGCYCKILCNCDGGREVGILFPIVFKSRNIMNMLSAMVIITSNFCNYILYLCLCSAFLMSHMYKHM